MITISISDVKAFTSDLFLTTGFDSFLLVNATIVTYNTFQIDGHIQKAFFDTEPEQEISSWETLRPFCFQLIKGKRTPLSFKLIFQLPPEKTADFLTEYQLDSTNVTMINGLYVNILYEKELSCITGCSLNIFTMDKSIEHAWDSYVKSLLKSYE